ncbi:MAG: hypothetical protein E7051_06075 [Lentisphaerae bacterium]|nr:hypothetical protein [Lentisphaerota bacterium]
MRFRQVHLDFHTGPAIPEVGQSFDKKDWQDKLKRARVNSITCFSLCHHGMSYHPTKVGMMHPGLKYNLLRAQIEASKEIGVNVPIYLTGGINNYAAETHPEWRQINADGKYYGWVASPVAPGFRQCCFNTAYLDYLCDHLVESCTMFPEADGVFIDIIHDYSCCCQKCFDGMLEAGLDPVKEEDRKKFGRTTLMKYYRRTVEAIRSVRSDMPIFHNSGNVPIGDHEILPYFTHLELESLPTGGWGYDHYPISAAYSRNLGMDFLGMTGKFHCCWGEFGGFKHPNALRYECAAMLAQNSKCSIGDQMHPCGKLDDTTYDIIGKAYEEVEIKEEFCENASCAATTVILANDEYDDGVIGAARFLLENHLPFDIVDCEMPTDKYDLMIVPFNRVLNEKEKVKVTEFAAKGGKAVLTCNTAFDENGKAILDFGGEISEDSPYVPDYVKLDDDVQGMFRTPFLMHLRSKRVKAVTARSLAKVYDPYFNRDAKHFCSHQHTPYCTEESGFDAALLNGNILYFAHPVFALYRNSGAVMHKKYIRSILDELMAGKYQVETANLPSVGRVTLMKQEKEKRLVCHVLYAPFVLRGGRKELEGRQNNLFPTEVIEDIPDMFNVQLKVKVDSAAVESVTLEPEHKEIPFTVHDGFISFTIAQFNCHTMAVIKLK